MFIAISFMLWQRYIPHFQLGFQLVVLVCFTSWLNWDGQRHVLEDG